MKTGKAYGFLNYEGRWQELIGIMGVAKQKANFPDTLSFTILDDKVSTMYDNEREQLPAKIAQLAETTDVRGSVPSNCSHETFKKLSDIKPVKASNLRYLVMAEAPEVSDSRFAEAPGQGMANKLTAEMLSEVLGFVGEGERKIGASDIFREIVFYQDGRGKARSPYL